MSDGPYSSPVQNVPSDKATMASVSTPDVDTQRCALQIEDGLYIGCPCRDRETRYGSTACAAQRNASDQADRAALQSELADCGPAPGLAPRAGTLGEVASPACNCSSEYWLRSSRVLRRRGLHRRTGTGRRFGHRLTSVGPSFCRACALERPEGRSSVSWAACRGR